MDKDMFDSLMESKLLVLRYLRSNDPSNKFFTTGILLNPYPLVHRTLEGPSAGITMMCSLLSLAKNWPVKRVALTGQVNSNGSVSPVGSVGPKVKGAKAANVKTVIVPVGNLRDVAAMTKHDKAGVTILSINDCDDILNLKFV